MSLYPPTPPDGFPAGTAAAMQEILLGSATEQKPLSSGFIASPGQVWTPPPPDVLQPCFPQYEILSLLGRGGMGAVYKAWQKSLSRHVAIKVLPPHAGDADASYTERFKQEGRSMAQLNHPSIIAVHDAGETPEGLLYFVMEFIEGTDVHQMVAAAGQLPPEHAHAIAAHVCEALAYAHAAGIIHRDIKPANIMVDLQGHVKVADFGLAKLTTQGGGLTQSNMAMGTPDFVSPEALIPGVPLDGRADLYAVGVMLYQMLTGKVPRGAWSPASVVIPGLDPRWDAIISKAMQMDREDRHSSAIELRQHLDTILQHPAAPAAALPATPSKQTSKLSHSKAIMLASAAVAILATGAFLGLKPNASPNKVAPPVADATPPKVEAPVLLAQADTRPKHERELEPGPTGGAAAVPARRPDPAKWVRLNPVTDCWTSYKTKFEDGGWRVGGNGETARLATKRKFQDSAIRARIHVIDKSASLEVRIARAEDGAQEAGSYRVGIRPKGVEIGRTLEVNGEKKDDVLAFYPLPSGVDLSKDVLTTISACGPVLTVWIEDQELGSVRDDHFSSGTMALWSYEATFRDVEYQVLDGAPPPSAVASSTAAPASSAASAKWLRLDPKTDCWGSRGLTELPDAWQIESSRIRSKQVFNDCAIRARLDAPSRSQGLAMRIMEAGFYQLSLKGDDVQLLRVNTSADPFTYENIKTFAGAAAHIPGEGLVLELKAEGPVLTASVGDRELGSVSDASFARGAIGCVAGAAATFRDIEYQMLDDAPAMPAAAAPSVPVASTIQQQPPELATLQQQYDKLVFERVSGVYDADKTKLDTGYLAGLDRAAATAQGTGQLDTVLAIQEEKKRVQAAGTAHAVPATDDVKTPEALKSLRGIYRTSLATLAEQRAANRGALLAPYATRLKQLETDFTKAGRISDAVLVKSYREGLGAVPVAVVPSAATAPAARETPAAMAAPKVKLPKEDPRVIVEWILAIGGDVRIEQNGYMVRLKAGDAVPKGRLIVREVGMTFMSKAPKQPVRDQDMDRLAGLEELTMIVLNKLDITGAGLRFMTACPKLTTVSLHNLNPGDEGFRYLAGLDNLRVLDFNTSGKITAAQLQAISHLPIEMLGLAVCTFSDEDLKPVAQMNALKELNLRSNGEIGDASIASIKACKNLEFLDATGTNITLAAMADLQGLPLNALYYGKADTTWDLATFRALAGLFPKLTAFGFPGEGVVSSADIQFLAEVFPDLKSIYMRASKIQDGTLAALTRLTKLENLHLYKAKNLTDDMMGDLAGFKKLNQVDVYGTSLTDAALDHFTKIKSLRTLVLGATQITEGGLQAFKKVRPDVKASR